MVSGIHFFPAAPFTCVKATPEAFVTSSNRIEETARVGSGAGVGETGFGSGFRHAAAVNTHAKRRGRVLRMIMISNRIRSAPGRGGAERSDLGENAGRVRPEGAQGGAMRRWGSSWRRIGDGSAAATREIRTLIEDSVLKVDAGSGLVDRASKMVGEQAEELERVVGRFRVPEK